MDSSRAGQYHTTCRKRCRRIILSTACATLALAHCCQAFGPNSMTTTTRHSRLYSNMPRATLNVRIDRPLLDESLLFTRKAKTSVATKVYISMLKPIASLLQHKLTKVALAAFLVSILLTIVLQNSNSNLFKSISQTVYGSLQRTMDVIKRQRRGTPMPFDANVDDGWGVCTLQYKKKLGKSNYIEYGFSLPRSDYVLPLELSQQLSFMYLDSNSNVQCGDFYPFLVKPHTKGSFSILVPASTSHETNVLNLGNTTSNLVRTLQREMHVGDEIAIQPGKCKLSYNGEFLPVTDMVYIACGLGIVPVLDQVRAVLPKGSSSVESVTVLWTNEETKDFDVTSELLEKEYYKYSSKLAVSCIVDNLRRKQLEDCEEIRAALPRFKPGIMAVLAGPADITRKAQAYLEQQLGYPKDTICIM